MDRWAALFADLAGELAGAEAAELDAEVRDRARRELARQLLVDRLTAARGHDLTVTTAAGAVRGTLDDAAPEWLVLADGARQHLVALRHVLAVDGLPPHAEEPAKAVERLNLGYALRALARRRVPVSVTLAGGTVLGGTFDRVAGDYAELAEHPPHEPRRPAHVTRTRAIPLRAVVAVRSELVV
ncbi:MAG TPA: DUF2642 domain-containing protein [Mycobacteriales bacterium]|jgi:hypothetical protein